VRIVAVPRDENDVLEEDRARLMAWTPSNGWSYVEYIDVFDLLGRISELQRSTAEPIAELEIIAHGNPAMCDDITIGNVAIAGASLRRVDGITANTRVYLSGCNTGLELNGECVARSFADAFRGPAHGARGYLAGTRAQRNERCVASFELGGIVYHAYPGGADATGDDVWVQFGTLTRPSGGGDDMQIKIATSGFRPVNLADRQGQDLVSAVEQVLKTPAVPSARMRMAPDLTFAIRLSDGERVFELLAGGTVLRDPVTRNVWQFEQGREILRGLLPYRKLPAA
jgi:hypothetical protein